MNHRQVFFCRNISLIFFHSLFIFSAEHDVTGYPTLKFFKAGEEAGSAEKYRQARDIAALTKFINQKIGLEVEEEVIRKKKRMPGNIIWHKNICFNSFYWMSFSFRRMPSCPSESRKEVICIMIQIWSRLISAFIHFTCTNLNTVPDSPIHIYLFRNILLLGALIT